MKHTVATLSVLVAALIGAPAAMAADAAPAMAPAAAAPAAASLSLLRAGAD